MSYLLIRNKGLAPIQAFTILGLSTARGEADKIGQFGSGSKHGILALMRAGIAFSIFIGRDELKFFTVEAQMDGHAYKEVRYRWMGEDHKTGMCLEFGALDWDNVRMSLREFICNALDQGEQIGECVAMTETMATAEDETRIYVYMAGDVHEYWVNLRSHFLHFEGQEKTEILPARVPAAQFYRRGVYVTQSDLDKNPALFCYNFQDGKIDECRNLDRAAVHGIAAKLLLKCKASLVKIFETFGGAQRYWEHAIGGSLYVYSGHGKKELTREAYRQVFGDVPFTDEQQVLERLRKRNIPCVALPAPGWTSFLAEAGLVNGRTLLSNLDEFDGEECEATESAIETFRRCWGWIEQARLTEGKPFPEVRCFSCPMKEGQEIHGYQKGDTVYLNLDFDTNEQAALEELAHYITGAKDETRDFQDWAFKLATRIAKLRTIKP